ncbi:MAG TPA: hypothetical protein VD866_04585 [Urbifossiella sp.]|nr:hypothetical protein [Urbifossiella sp.]
MAWEEWKEVLLPGRQRDRHGDWFEFTPRDIRAAFKNVGRMLSRGVSLPGVWEHVKVEAGDTDARKAAYAKYTFGHVVGRRLNGRGGLDLRLKGEDERDLEQLRKTRFVSPKVCPGYSDSKGGEYRGLTIAHVAATPTPVQFWQKPFELSRGRPLYLSFQPGGDAMPDDPKKPVDGDGKKTGAKTLADVIDALREKGFNIPQEVTDETGLVIAIKAGGDLDGGGDTDPDLELDDAVAGTDATANAPGAPMLMSEKRVGPFRKMTRRDLGARVNKLLATGRVARPTAVKLMNQVKTVEMSFTTDGELYRNPLADRIAAYEDLPKHSAWKPDGRTDARDLSVTEIDPPDELRGDGKKADEEATNFLLGPTREAAAVAGKK